MTNPQKKPLESERETLVSKAAKRAIETAGDDLTKAVSVFENSVRKDKRLREAVLEPLINEACYAVITRHFRTERRHIWNAPEPRAASEDVKNVQSNRVIHLAAGTLLMFPLPGGKRLGDATREEIAAAARFYQTQTDDMAIKAKWLRLVAKSVPEGKTVGQVLSNAVLKKLQKKAGLK